MGDLVEHVALKNRVEVFRDRHEAGQALAEELMHCKAADAVVLAIPSGGLPVASEISRATGLAMDLVVVRKLQIPGNPEAGFGALSPDGETVLNENLVNQLRLTPDQIREQTEKTLRPYRVLRYPTGMLRYPTGMLRYRYPPGRPGYPAEGWVVFLNATWYRLRSIDIKNLFFDYHREID